MENVYVFAFATFGHPNDFRQNCFLPEKRQSDIKVKLFDLTNAIKIYPKSTLYSIRKENVNGVNIVSYTIYTYAKEKTSDRDGTFIGSSIIYTNGIANENVTIERLKNFHNELINKNVIDERLIVNHSNEFTISKSVTIDFDKLSYNLKKPEEPSNYNSSNNNVVVYSLIDPNTLQQNFKKALELLNNYDTIFFTDSEEIAKFTISKRLYKFLDENKKEFSNAIEGLRDEKKRQLEIIVNDFQKEISDLADKKNETVRKFKDGIAENKNLHRENGNKIAEYDRQTDKIVRYYAEYEDKIKEAISLINSNKNIDVVKSFHNENKRQFINLINQNTKPTYLNSLNNIQARTSLTSNHQSNSDWSQPNSEKSNNEQSKKKKPFKIFKLVSILFFLLWLITIIYYQAYQIPKKNKIIQDYEYQLNQNIIEEDNEEKDNESISHELNPKPNNQLNLNDIKNIAKSIKNGMSLEDVVKLIFEKNPTDIKKHYENQIEIYSKKIIELNNNCFEEKDGKNYYKQDTIKYIPSFKSNN
jgi:hypothetical protein